MRLEELVGEGVNEGRGLSVEDEQRAAMMAIGKLKQLVYLEEVVRVGDSGVH